MIICRLLGAHGCNFKSLHHFQKLVAIQPFIAVHPLFLIYLKLVPSQPELKHTVNKYPQKWNSSNPKRKIQKYN